MNTTKKSQIIEKIADLIRAGNNANETYLDTAARIIEALDTLATEVREELIKKIEKRINYGKEYRLKNEEDLRNGWSGIESGACCSKCKIVNPTGMGVALKKLVGCTNPFQLKESHGRKLCQCHLPFRKVAEESIQQVLKEICEQLQSQGEDNG